MSSFSLTFFPSFSLSLSLPRFLFPLFFFSFSPSLPIIYLYIYLFIYLYIYLSINWCPPIFLIISPFSPILSLFPFLNQFRPSLSLSRYQYVQIDLLVWRSLLLYHVIKHCRPPDRLCLSRFRSQITDPTGYTTLQANNTSRLTVAVVNFQKQKKKKKNL